MLLVRNHVVWAFTTYGTPITILHADKWKDPDKVPDYTYRSLIRAEPTSYNTRLAPSMQSLPGCECGICRVLHTLEIRMQQLLRLNEDDSRHMLRQRLSDNPTLINLLITAPGEEQELLPPQLSLEQEFFTR